MKKMFLFAAAAMVSLSSCVQSEEIYTGEVTEIGFKSAVTRAIISKQEDLKLYPIAVTAIWDNPNDASGKYNVRFENEKFIYDDGDLKKWRGETAQYWPNGGNMHFLAFSPYPSNAVITNNFNATTGKFETMEISKIDNNILNQHDILFSDLHAVDAPAPAPQPLQFHHALTQVNVEFKITNATADVSLQEVMLMDIVMGGTLTVTPNEGAPSAAEWTLLDNVKDRYFNRSLDASGIEDKALDAKLASDKAYSPLPLLILPAATQTKMKIVYTVDGHREEKLVDLSQYGDWKMGYKYTYKIEINLNQIIFDCTVYPWEDATLDDDGKIIA